MKQNIIIKKVEKIISTAKDESKLIFNIVKLVRNLLKDKRVPKNIKYILYGYLIYFISPIDIIPDFIPTGYMDDLFIGLLVISYLLKNLDEKLILKNWEGDLKQYRKLKRHCRFVEWILPKFIKRWIFGRVHLHIKKHIKHFKKRYDELID